MAMIKAKQSALGSAQWVQEENDHASQAIASELADFGFSVKNEMEWLNEKMADVFSRDPKTLTDILKTPGKLRGKTPRTVRQDAHSVRRPLADMFAHGLNASTPRHPNPAPNLAPQTFKIIEDVENQQLYTKPASRSKSPQRVGKKGNTDSGYHGMTEDETDTDSQSQQVALSVQQMQDQRSEDVAAARPGLDDTSRSVDESFQSAREEPAAKQIARSPVDAQAADIYGGALPHSAFFYFTDEQQLEPTVVDEEAGDDTEIAKPSQRKSSFNFSSLPAREPLQPKRSIGGRNSFLDQNTRTSILSKIVRNASGTSVTHDDRTDAPPEIEEQPVKSTAQRLHERITLLGKTRDARLSAMPVASSQDVAYPVLPSTSSASQYQATLGQTAVSNDAQLHANKSGQADSSPRPMHQKHMSVPDFTAVSKASPVNRTIAQKTASLHNVPTDADARPHTPSTSSRAKNPSEGPLSASKNRLMSVLKSARSIFASSASASAAAKLEAHDALPDRQAASRDISNGSASAAVMLMPGALYSDASISSNGLKAEEDRQREHVKELKAPSHPEAASEHPRQQERAIVTQDADERGKQETEGQQASASTNNKASTRVTGKLKPISKQVRPAKESSVPKPAPVNIKVGSQLKTLQEPYSRPGSVMRPSSALSTAKSTVPAASGSRARAMEVAARKKELEDREKQRKAQQKKELDRKRIAKAEEDLKAEQARKAEEQRRAHEELERQKLHAEQQRAQQQRQVTQKREEDAQRAKAAQELAEAIQQERAHQQAQLQPRNDATGTLRQLSAKLVGDPRPPVNPAKPPKRALETADGDESQRPVTQPATYQATEGKRRKTDENVDSGQRVSVMGPPKRPSTIRKETLTRFPVGYAVAPPPTHQPSGMFKAVINNQHQMQQAQRPTHPNQTVQISTARIAFAENTTPAVAAPSGRPAEAASQGQHNKFKTPIRAVQAQASTVKSAKSSPAFTQGDAIALPDIATDSEDEDDDDEDDEQGTGFRAPSWVASPALRGLLTEQQLIDPETVFGPIGELRMEEVFKGAKNADRLKKFRDRGSSAAWVQSGDAITSAEKRRDMQLRERVAREGGWRYEPGL